MTARCYRILTVLESCRCMSLIKARVLPIFKERCMQFLESVCKFQINVLYAQPLTPPLDYRPFQKYE